MTVTVFVQGVWVRVCVWVCEEQCLNFAALLPNANCSVVWFHSTQYSPHYSFGHGNVSSLKVQGRSTTLTSQGGTILHFDVVLHVPVNLPESPASHPRNKGAPNTQQPSSNSDCTPHSSADHAEGSGGHNKGASHHGGRGQRGDRSQDAQSRQSGDQSQHPSPVNAGSAAPHLVGAAGELGIALVAVPDRWKVALLKFWDDPYMHAETQVGAWDWIPCYSIGLLPLILHDHEPRRRRRFHWSCCVPVCRRHGGACCRCRGWRRGPPLITEGGPPISHLCERWLAGHWCRVACFHLGSPLVMRIAVRVICLHVLA